MKRLQNTLLFTAAIACNSASAAIEPASIPLGPVALVPTIGLQTGYDDNIFSSTTDEVDSIVTTITPSVQIIAEDGYNAYRVQYQFSKGIYTDSSDDNYLDHDLSADAHLEFSARSRLDLNAAYSKGHEARGTGLTQSGSVADSVTAPLEFDTKSVSFSYEYGAVDATGRIVLAGRLLEKEYQNFRSITDERDTEENTLSATFYYRIMPKTSLLFEVRENDIDYVVDPANSLDSTTRRYYVGATWESTAKTTGTIKLGRLNKDFSSSNREDFSGNSWEAAVEWAPLTYSVLNLSSSQTAKESSNSADYIDSKTVQLNWNHDWDDQISTTASTGFTKDEYKGTTGGREDDITNAGLSINYDMRRWLSFGMSYNYQDTDSNTADISYNRNLYMLSVSGSL